MHLISLAYGHASVPSSSCLGRRKYVSIANSVKTCLNERHSPSERQQDFEKNVSENVLKGCYSPCREENLVAGIFYQMKDAVGETFSPQLCADEKGRRHKNGSLCMARMSPAR